MRQPARSSGGGSNIDYRDRESLKNRDHAHSTWLVLDNGELWDYQNGYGWQRWGTMPFPVSELRIFTGQFAVHQSGNLWWREDGAHWVLIGPPPGSSSIGENPNLMPSTWGRIKARGRK